MRIMIIFITVLVLEACSFSGFKPPKQDAHWTSDEYIQYRDYWDRRNTDMRACGIDPYNGYHTSVKEGLCMEAKGWYWTRGCVCEDWYNINDPLCAKWRVKTGRPKPPVKK